MWKSDLCFSDKPQYNEKRESSDNALDYSSIYNVIIKYILGINKIPTGEPCGMNMGKYVRVVRGSQLCVKEGKWGNRAMNQVMASFILKMMIYFQTLFIYLGKFHCKINK